MGGYRQLPVTPFEPQQTTPLASLAQVQQLKNAQQEGALRQQQVEGAGQENQIRQQQIKDQQAMTAAMQEWDGKDFSVLPSLVLKHGASANAVIGLKTQIVKQQQDVANLSKDQLAIEKTKNDYFAQQIENVKSLPPEQQPQAFQTAVSDAVQKGHLDPQTAQGLQYQGPEQLDLLEKSMMGHSAVVEQALKKAQTDQAAATASQRGTQGALNQEKLDLIQNAKPEDYAGLVDQIVPPGTPENSRTKAMVNFYIQRGDVESAQKALTQTATFAGDIDKGVALATNPQIQQGKIDVATAEGQARANVEAQTARGSNAALANVPKQLIAPAESAATKAGEDYAAAQAVTQRMNATMEAARRGNVVSYQIIPEEGTLQITTSQGVHRINRTEIEQYAGGGSLWQRLEGHFGKQLSGKSIPDSVLTDMAEIQKIQADGAKSKYENSLKTINQNYGSSFKPVEMGQSNSGGYQEGQTVTIKGKQMKVKKVYPDGSFDAE